MHKFLDINKFEPPWIIAHRGYRARYPENTLIAFQAALDAGVPMIELDVTLSKDRKLVVIHDATLERTTNGHGPVSGTTLKQLKQLDAGGWFHPDFAGERIPELTEVLNLTNGRAFVNIEIKPHSHEAHNPTDAVEYQLIELICHRNIEDFVLISSFDLNILQRLTNINHSCALGLISRQPADKNTAEICYRIKAVSWHPNHQILTIEQVKMMHTRGIRVFPYNADSAEEIRRVVDMGVDGVISSDPLLFRNLII
jgi:glycerophosphoryl diester phosphodiesterase